MGEIPSVADFFSRVVPWPTAEAPGVVCMNWSLVKIDHAMGGRPFTTLVGLTDYIPIANGRAATIKDIYFCLSLQRETGPVRNGYATVLRNAGNVVSLKAVWVDLDIGETGYSDTAAALQGVHDFCEKSGYPRPTAIVFSGSGGCHVYWISDRPLSLDEWRSYAAGLKAAGIKHGLRADWQCTIDSVRLLRVPGTFNHKTKPAKPCVLKMLAPADINFDTVLAGYRADVVVGPQRAPDPVCFDAAALPKREPDPKWGDTQSEEYKMRVGRTGMPPLEPAGILTQCPMFAHTLETGGKEAGQPLWMLQVLATTFMAGGRDVAHKISKGYKTYQPAETDEMYDRKESEQEARGLGWPSCKAFENHGSTQCKSCPFAGKIKSPLNLGAPQRVDDTLPFAMALPTADPAAPSLHLPEGYSLQAKTGYIGTVISKQTGGGGSTTEFITLVDTQLKHPWREKDVGLHFLAEVDRNRWVPCCLPLIEMGTASSVAKCLRAQGVVVTTSHEKDLEKFMTTWIKKLRAEQDAQESVGLGWDDQPSKALGWAYNGKIVRSDKSENDAGVFDPQMTHSYTPRGSLDVWYKVLKLVTEQKRPALEAIIATSFAAPLMRFTGQDGGTIVANGKTAANKSTACKIGLAVWGHPMETKTPAESSSKGVMKQMGTVRNLPIYWDDVNEKSRIEQAVKLVRTATEGGEGFFLTTGRNFAKRGYWQTLVQINTNKSIFDSVIQHMRSSEAEVSRVFEYYVPKADDSTPGRLASGAVAGNIVAELNTNYGKLGEIYSQLLGQYSTDLHDAVIMHMKTFEDAVKPLPSERFWIACCGALLTGAYFANKMGATLDFDALQKFLFAEYMALRARVHGEALDGGTVDNTDAALTGFLKKYTDHSVRIRNMPRVGRYAAKEVGLIAAPEHPKPIHISWVTGSRMLRVSAKAFTEYLNENDYSPSDIMRGLKKHYGMSARKADLAIGVWQGGRETAWYINVPEGSWLEEVMLSFTSASLLIQPGELSHSSQTNHSTADTLAPQDPDQ